MSAISGSQNKSMAVASKSKAKNSPSFNKPSGQTVPIRLKAKSAPLWLLRLCYFQRRFCVVTYVLVAATLAVYAWTISDEKSWSQAYRKLEILQSREWQLVTTSEVLKNQMALQAEQPAMELMPHNPAEAIFLVPAPQRPAPAAEPYLPATNAATQTKPLPFGY